VSDNVLQVSDAEFDAKVLKSSTPFLVGFWAGWCGPCMMIAPILEDIAVEYAGHVIVAKVNIDNIPATPQAYGVRGIPTLILFKDGAAAAQKVGAMAKGQLTAFVDSNI